MIERLFSNLCTFRFKSIIFAFTLAVSNASYSVDSGVKYRLPILSECKEFTERYLTSRNDLNFKYYKFDSSMDSHREVAGFVEIWGRKIDRNEFSKIRNLISFKCGTNSSQVISENSNYIDELRSSIHFHSRRGVENFYIKIDGDRVEIHMRKLSNEDKESYWGKF